MVRKSMDLLTWLRKQLEEADPDLLRAMVNEFVSALMGAEVDALCNAAYNERTPERSSSAEDAKGPSGADSRRARRGYPAAARAGSSEVSQRGPPSCLVGWGNPR